VAYAQIKENGELGSYYALTIPHFNESKKQQLKSNRPPDYKKGQEEIYTILDDNSKFVANCFDKQECDRLWIFWRKFIDPQFLKKNPIAKIGPRKGVSLKTYRVRAIFARFFEKGQENTVPQWEIRWK
jgi:hypothetical protein